MDYTFKLFDIDENIHNIDYIATKDTYIGKLFNNKNKFDYEVCTISVCLAIISKLYKEKKDITFFDIGANIGIYSIVVSLFLKKYNKTIIAFEPTPDLSIIMNKFRDMNHLEFKTEKCALSNTKGRGDFYLSNKTSSSNSLVKGFRTAKGILSVKLDTLDNYCAEMNLIPTLIKIDTETNEPDIIEGACAIINKYRPYIVCEVLWNRTENDLMKVLKKHDYKYYQIVDNDLILNDEIVGDKTYIYRDWLFSPNLIDNDLINNYKKYKNLFDSL